jgi:hypothetical protein
VGGEVFHVNLQADRQRNRPTNRKTDGQVDGEIGMTKVIVISCNFAKRPKEELRVI